MMRRCALLFAVLLAADQLTKLLIPTPEWGWDPKGFGLHPALGLLAVGVFVAYKPTLLAGTFYAAGLCGNVLSSLSGPVANPFVVNNIAFNPADLMLLAGLVLTFCSVPAIFRCQQAFGKKRGWTW